MLYFASDNNSGVHPEVMEALSRANTGNTPAYGGDAWTLKSEELFESVFGSGTRAFFVFLGTAANVLGLKSILKPYEGIICAESAHIVTDECGAMEAAGRKMYLIPQRHGKIDLRDCARVLQQFGNSVHNVAPRVLSITQSTECGTLYSLEELKEISAFCRANGLYLHMDGARAANAAAALGVSLRGVTRDAGVDILTLGGTKNGLMFGEAVVFFNPELARDFEFYRKQGMQLGSKMRFISAQFQAYLQNGLWLENASWANAMTRLLADKIQDLPGVRFVHPVCVNAIFARLPRKILDGLSDDYCFSVWDEAPDPEEPRIDGPVVRIMTSFNTTEREVLDLAAAIRSACGL